MRVRIPYTYQVVGIPQKKRTETKTYVGDYYHTELLEIDDLDAPIATQWDNKEGETLQTRWFEGRHWIIQKTSDKQLLTKHKLEELISAGLINGNPTMNFSTSPKSQEFVNGELPAFSKDSFRSITSTEQEAVLENLKDLTENCIIVDDKVWVKSGEPYYVFDRRQYGTLPDGKHFIEPKIALTPEDPLTIHWAHETYSANQLDLLEVRASGFDEVQVLDEHKIHVILPESIKYDADWYSLLLTAQDYVNSSRKALGHQTTDVVRHWADLLDTIELATDNPTEDIKERLHALAKSCLKFNDCVLPRRLDEVADRWNNRDIPLDFDVSNIL